MYGKRNPEKEREISFAQMCIASKVMGGKCATEQHICNERLKSHHHIISGDFW